MQLNCLYKRFWLLFCLLPDALGNTSRFHVVKKTKCISFFELKVIQFKAQQLPLQTRGRDMVAKSPRKFIIRICICIYLCEAFTLFLIFFSTTVCNAQGELFVCFYASYCYCSLSHSGWPEQLSESGKKTKQ